MSKDFVFASQLQDTSNDSFPIQEEIIEPSISNEIKKEETLTPPELAKQYEFDFIQNLEMQSFFPIHNEPKKIINKEQILEEHSYFTKKGMR